MRGGTVNTDFLTEKSEIHAWGEESARAAIETASASTRCCCTMPLDELGVDPYQRAAVTFARRAGGLILITLPGGISCYKYGQYLGSEGDRLTLIGIALMVFSLVLCIAGYQRLRREGLEAHMVCLPGP